MCLARIAAVRGVAVLRSAFMARSSAQQGHQLRWQVVFIMQCLLLGNPYDLMDVSIVQIPRASGGGKF